MVRSGIVLILAKSPQHDNPPGQWDSLYCDKNVDKATALYDEAISLARDAKGDGKLSLIC
jgi:hypothetical protein